MVNNSVAPRKSPTPPGVKGTIPVPPARKNHPMSNSGSKKGHSAPTNKSPVRNPGQRPQGKVLTKGPDSPAPKQKAEVKSDTASGSGKKSSTVSVNVAPTADGNLQATTCRRGTPVQQNAGATSIVLVNSQVPLVNVQPLHQLQAPQQQQSPAQTSLELPKQEQTNQIQLPINAKQNGSVSDNESRIQDAINQFHQNASESQHSLETHRQHNEQLPNLGIIIDQSFDLQQPVKQQYSQQIQKLELGPQTPQQPQKFSTPMSQVMDQTSPKFIQTSPLQSPEISLQQADIQQQILMKQRQLKPAPMPCINGVVLDQPLNASLDSSPNEPKNPFFKSQMIKSPKLGRRVSSPNSGVSQDQLLVGNESVSEKIPGFLRGNGLRKGNFSGFQPRVQAKQILGHHINRRLSQTQGPGCASQPNFAYSQGDLTENTSNRGSSNNLMTMADFSISTPENLADHNTEAFGTLMSALQSTQSEMLPQTLPMFPSQTNFVSPKQRTSSISSTRSMTQALQATLLPQQSVPFEATHVPTSASNAITEMTNSQEASKESLSKVELRRTSIDEASPPSEGTGTLLKCNPVRSQVFPAQFKKNKIIGHNLAAINHTFKASTNNQVEHPISEAEISYVEVKPEAVGVETLSGDVSKIQSVVSGNSASNTNLSNASNILLAARVDTTPMSPTTSITEPAQKSMSTVSLININDMKTKECIARELVGSSDSGVATEAHCNEEKKADAIPKPIITSSESSAAMTPRQKVDDIAKEGMTDKLPAEVPLAKQHEAGKEIREREVTSVKQRRFSELKNYKIGEKSRLQAEAQAAALAEVALKDQSRAMSAAAGDSAASAPAPDQLRAKCAAAGDSAAPAPAPDQSWAKCAAAGDSAAAAPASDQSRAKCAAAGDSAAAAPAPDQSRAKCAAVGDSAAAAPAPDQSRAKCAAAGDSAAAAPAPDQSRAKCAAVGDSAAAAPAPDQSRAKCAAVGDSAAAAPAPQTNAVDPAPGSDRCLDRNNNNDAMEEMFRKLYGKELAALQGRYDGQVESLTALLAQKEQELARAKSEAAAALQEAQKQNRKEQEEMKLKLEREKQELEEKHRREREEREEREREERYTRDKEIKELREKEERRIREEQERNERKRKEEEEEKKILIEDKEQSNDEQEEQETEEESSKRALEKLQVEMLLLRQQNEEFEEMVREKYRRQVELEVQIGEMNKEIASKEANIQSVKVELSYSKNETELTRGLVKRLTEELEELKQRVESLEQELEASERELKRMEILQEKLQVTEAKKNEMQAQINDIELERDEEIKIIQDALDEAAEEREELLTTFEKELERLTAQNAAREAQMLLEFEEKLKELERQHKKQIEDKEREAKAALQRNKRMADEEEVRQRLEKLRSDLNSEWEDKLRRECSRLKGELDELHAEEKHLAVESVKVQKDQELHATKKNLEVKAEALNKEISTLKESLVTKEELYQQELDDVRTQADRDVWELRRKLQRLDETTYDRRQQLEDKHREELERLREEYADKLSGLEAQLACVDVRGMEDLRTKLETCHKTEVEHLCQQHRLSMERLRDELEAEKAQAAEEARVLVTKHHEYIIEGLRDQLAEAVTTAAQYRDEIEAIKFALSRREEVIRSLEEDVARLRSSKCGTPSSPTPAHYTSQSPSNTQAPVAPFQFPHEGSQGSRSSQDRLSNDTDDDGHKGSGLLGKVFGGGWFSGGRARESSTAGYSSPTGGSSKKNRQST
ncbi:ribosome-binding protein 1 isoform X1 [Hyalella azteca]|uniref:Ribosome-binding protein 1 isoform X1 n=1 Tax=Hyalella azteca TaxID=294128 RepID=A0A979FGI0_HYAAZ|nr:ribosome-binding protein 1 isoform X1 [Hyalella azteca]